MELPENLKPAPKGYSLIAKSNGWKYSLKSRNVDKWVHNRSKKPVEYVPDDYYKPSHQKNTRLGAKLLICDKWPDFKADFKERRAAKKKH